MGKHKSTWTWNPGIGAVAPLGAYTGTDGRRLMTKVHITLVLRADNSLIDVDLASNIGEDIAELVWAGCVQTENAASTTLMRPAMRGQSLNDLTPEVIEAGALHTYHRNFGELRPFSSLLEREIGNEDRPEWQRFALASALALLTARYGAQS